MNIFKKTSVIPKEKDLYIGTDLKDHLEITGPLQEEQIILPYGDSFEETYLSNVKMIQSHDLIIERLQRLQDTVDNGNERQDRDHSTILAHCQRTEDLLRQSKQENERLCRLLAKNYPVERMIAIAAGVLFACSLSFIANIFFGFRILHPVLALIGILASVVFLGMAHWRNKHAK